MNALSISLGVIYLLVPLVAMVATAWRAWRTRSKSSLRPLLGTFISAAVIGFAINFAYAHAAAASWRWSQVLLASWFIAAVLLILKAFDLGIQKALSRLARRRRRVAAVVRCAVLFLVGMPYVMALGMVYRPK